MEIQITKSLLRILIKSYLTEWNINISPTNIEKKIFNLLLLDKIIDDTLTFDSINWNIINDQFQGIYIPEINNVVYFTQMLDRAGKIKSRNTWLAQNFRPSFIFAKQHNAKMSISINPIDTGKRPNIADFIFCTAKTIISLGIKINDSLSILIDNPYESLNDLIDERRELRQRNTGNNSTYINVDNENKKIIVNGKLDGVNGSDTFLMCCFLYKYKQIEPNFHDYEIQFFDITPTEKKYSNKVLEQIQLIGINTSERINITSDISNFLQSGRKNILSTDNQEQILKRNQNLFRANILRRYCDVPGFNVDKCFACNYLLSNNLKAAHIYRFADIVNDYENGQLTLQQALHLITSGDNGFLLCPTHDSEYEAGQIIFDLNQKKFVFNENCRSLNEEQINQVKNNILSADFSNIQFSLEFVNNVTKHINRVNSNPNLTRNS